MQILQERMKALDPNKNEIYKFLGCKQAERTDMKKVMERLWIQMEQRTGKLQKSGKMINCRVIPVAAYMMNVCNFTGKELHQFDKGIKTVVTEHSMHGKQCSDDA